MPLNKHLADTASKPALKWSFTRKVHIGVLPRFSFYP
jgi:hypothetical protein